MMDREQIIQWAREAGFMLVTKSDPETGGWYECFDDELEAFAKLVAKHAIAQDREAVALLIEKRGAQGYGTLAIAAEVRADNACSTLCHPEEPCFITEDGMCAKRGSHGQT
jgi:hypothetical protein